MSDPTQVGPLQDIPSNSFKLLTPVPFRSLGTTKFFQTFRQPATLPTQCNPATLQANTVPTLKNTHIASHSKVSATRSLDRQVICKNPYKSEISDPLPRSKSIGAWFESVQKQQTPKHGLVWTREKKSPFHERIQKTKSLYEEMTQDKEIDTDNHKQVAQTTQHNKCIHPVKQIKNLPPKTPLEPKVSNGPIKQSSSKYDEYKARATTQRVSIYKDDLNYHKPVQMNLPSNVPLALQETPKCKQTSQLNLISNVVPTLQDTQPITKPNCTKAVQLKPGSNVVSTLQDTPRNAEPESRKVVQLKPVSDITSTLQNKQHMGETNCKQTCSISSPHSTPINANGSQQAVVKNVVKDNMSHRFQNGFPASDIKSRSLPGFYQRRNPSQDGFAANRISYFENSSKPPATPRPTISSSVVDIRQEKEQTTEDKKSKSFFKKLFTGKKSVNGNISSSSNDTDSDREQRSWLSRRMRRKKVSNSTSSLPIAQDNKKPVLFGSMQNVHAPMNYHHVMNGQPSNQQTLGIPVLTRPLGEASISYDSLPISPRSNNSESAYGSINSISHQSQILGGISSSTDTLSRREKKEAAMAKVEWLRRSQKDSSSEDELNVSRSSHSNRNMRSSRTERYMRRKSQEMESLRRETEKDRRTKAIVEARIKEIQNVQLREAQRYTAQHRKLQNEEKPKWSARLVYQESNEFDEVVLGIPRIISPHATPISSHHPNMVNGSHTASYDNHINKASSVPPNCSPWRHSNVITKASPTPPRRHSSRFLSPESTSRPMSYSFENATPHQRKHLFSADIKVPYYNNKGFEKKIFQPILQDQRVGAPVPYGMHSKGHPTSYQKVHGSEMCSNLLTSNMPPSPSSDYSSGISENSSKGEKMNPFDTLNSVLQSEPYCLVQNNNLASDQIKPQPQSIQTPPYQYNQFDTGKQQESDRVQMRHQNATNCSLKVPEPPKRNSSNLSKDTRNLLSTQFKMLIEHDNTKHKDFRGKNISFFKNNSADVEQAIKEMEEIYKHLNLNIDNILEGAERRDLPTPHQRLWQNLDKKDPHETPIERSRSRTPRMHKSVTPDRIKDDFHFRRCQSTGPVNRKNLPPLQTSYLLISPVHGPPPEPRKSENLIDEPDIISDDLCYRNIQQANSVKAVEPQPPFGVPLKPVPHHSQSDYLHTKVKNNIKLVTSNCKTPDIDMDDMAFRNLRKENGVDKSLNLSVLDDALIELKTPPRNRSSSVDRGTINKRNNPNKNDFWWSKQVRHLPKNKSKKKFTERYKEALTDSETTFRSNHRNSKSDTTPTDLSPVITHEEIEIREALIAGSRNPCGGKSLEPYSITVSENEFPTLTMSVNSEKEHESSALSKGTTLDSEDLKEVTDGVSNPKSSGSKRRMKRTKRVEQSSTLSKPG